MGVMTKRDTVAIHFSSQKVKDTVADFARLERESLEKKYRGIHDARDWNLAGVKKNIREFGEDHLRPIMYRPFDYRHTYYTNFSRGFLAYPVFEVGRHMLQSNYCLTTIRKADVVQNWSHAFCLDGIMVHHGISMKEGNYIFPLYLYPTEQDLDQRGGGVAEQRPIGDGANKAIRNLRRRWENERRKIENNDEGLP